MNNKLGSFKSLLLFIIFFVTLFLFLPFTQDQFTTTKWYFIGFSMLFLFVMSLIQFGVTKKMTWVKKNTDSSLFLFLVAAALSVIFMSPGYKVQAIFQTQVGLLTFVFFFAFYFFISREKRRPSFFVGSIAVIGSILSLISLATAIPSISRLLPFSPGFLRGVQYFSPIGTVVDALLVLGFATVVLLGAMLVRQKENKSSLLIAAAFVLNAGTCVALFFTIVRNPNTFIFPPLSLSWYAAVETLKQPLTALFGVGIDNFPVMFARVKDATYNLSSIWQIPSFNVSRLAVLHIATEMGLLGFIAFLLVGFQMVKQSFGPHGAVDTKLMTIFFIASMLLFPPSFILFFLLFSYLGYLQIGQLDHEKTIDLKGVVPAYVGLLLFGGVVVGGVGFLLVRTYAAELNFNRALKTNNLKDVYGYMRQAIVENPYYERYRSNFAQVNLLIANNLAQRAQQSTQNDSEQKLSEQERQTISQAIQDAIKEGQAVVSLNSQKAANWALLGAIYRNIMSVAQGADAWTVSSYQRAIVLDPQNVQYRVELGGVLYTLKNYDEALQLFQQAIVLKPDWANAQYNYAWAAYQKADYVKAASAMQNTVSLLDPKKDAADYKRAAADLEEFKSKLPEEQKIPEGEVKLPNKLSLPQEQKESLEPKITLPKNASPEADL